MLGRQICGCDIDGSRHSALLSKTSRAACSSAPGKGVHLAPLVSRAQPVAQGAGGSTRGDSRKPPAATCSGPPGRVPITLCDSAARAGLPLEFVTRPCRTISRVRRCLALSDLPGSKRRSSPAMQTTRLVTVSSRDQLAYSRCATLARRSLNLARTTPGIPRDVRSRQTLHR